VKDLEILRSEFDVREYIVPFQPRWKIPFYFFVQFIVCFFQAFTAKAVVVQFAGFQSYVPFIVFGWFGRKRIIVAGGTDCVSFPSISYGNFSRKPLSTLTRRSFEKADLILPVDQTLIDYEYTYQNEDGKRQGYRNFCTALKAKEKVIWNGYDPSIWYDRNEDRNRGSFITVGAGFATRFGFQLKGIDLFLDLAKALPDCTFTIVGESSLPGRDVPENVKLIAQVPNSTLPQIYSRHQFYLQLSMSEGFPNALSEAMLCGCIPVVSNVGAMPMIVQDSRCILKKRDSAALLNLVNNLMSISPETNFAESVKSRFTFENRKRELLSEIQQTINSKR
jgi:glycosyltransferase involved in cell wall biosynthesis